MGQWRKPIWLKMSDLPIACSLTTTEPQERRTKVLEKVRAAALDVNETADGFAYRFPSDDALLADLLSLIQASKRERG
jgi:hypothetical protein